MKKILSMILLVSILSIIIGCSKNKLGGDEPLKNHGDLIFSVNSKRNSYIPVSLYVYENGEYELFTKYRACKSGEICVFDLKYTKSIKGNYSNDVIKIIRSSTISKEEGYTSENLPEYDFYMGNTYVKKGYEYNYTVEKGKTNKYLNEFLKEINVDLKICAEPEYVK